MHEPIWPESEGRGETGRAVAQEGGWRETNRGETVVRGMGGVILIDGGERALITCVPPSRNIYNFVLHNAAARFPVKRATLSLKYSPIIHFPSFLLSSNIVDNPCHNYYDSLVSSFFEAASKSRILENEVLEMTQRKVGGGRSIEGRDSSIDTIVLKIISFPNEAMNHWEAWFHLSKNAPVLFSV